MSPEDSQLFAHLSASAELQGFGVSLGRGERYGVAVSADGRPVGIWSFHRGEYRWRYLGNYEPVATAKTIDECLLLTLRMAIRRTWHDPRGMPGET